MHFRNFHSMPRESMARDIANMGLNVAVMNTKSLVAEIFSTDPAKRPGVQICKVLGRPNPEEYDRWNWIYHHWSEDQVPRWWFQPCSSKIHHFPRNRDENEENHWNHHLEKYVKHCEAITYRYFCWKDPFKWWNNCSCFCPHHETTYKF